MLGKKEWELKQSKDIKAILEEVVRGGLSFETMAKKYLEREREYEETKKQSAKLRAEHAEKELQIISKEIQARKEKNEKNRVYHSVIVAVAKDETPYLEEWFKYHLDLGFEHIFIHDDESKIPIKTTVEKLPEKYKNRIIVHDKKIKHPYSAQKGSQPSYFAQKGILARKIFCKTICNRGFKNS